MNSWEIILQKALVASGMDSKAWSEISSAIRQRAFFSAEVMEARILHEMRSNVSDIAKSGKSASEVRRDLRSYLLSIGYDAGDENRGTIKDLMTKARLDVMIKTNVDQAKGYATHIRATTAGAILAFPAYEFVRRQGRKVQRDWVSRWNKAGNAVGWQGVARNGQMIALKTSPIWTALSAFGNPFPPFDFNSGMGLRDVKKSVCREIGLLGPDEQPEIPKRPDFNGNLEAKVPFGENSTEYQGLKAKFGDKISFDNGTVRWKA